MRWFESRRREEYERLFSSVRLRLSGWVRGQSTRCTWVAEMRWIGINQIDHDASVDYRFTFLLSTFSPDNLNVWWMNILLLMTLLLSAPALAAPISSFFRRHE